MVDKNSVCAIVLLVVFTLLSSCSDLGLEKRRYRRGYHLHSSAAILPARKASAGSEQTVIKSANAFPEREADPEPRPDAVASLSHNVVFIKQKPFSSITEKVRSEKEVAQTVHPDRSAPVPRSRTQAIPEQEKRPWNVKSIVAFALGVLGFLMLPLTTTAASFGFLGSFWILPALLGIAFGIAALILAIKAKKEIRDDGSRGKGFALAGMIMGIESLVAGFIIGLIFLLMFFIGRK